jgi:hypothetical protein
MKLADGLISVFPQQIGKEKGDYRYPQIQKQMNPVKKSAMLS